MRIISFASVKLNGYLDFHLDFNKDINFIIGINRSGKTSVLKAIVACISPDIDWIMTAEYSQIIVGIEHNRKYIQISLGRSEASTLIVYKEDDQKPVQWRFTALEYSRNQDYYDEVVYNKNGERVRVREARTMLPLNNDVINKIGALPNPVFLGLDRTTLPVQRVPGPRTNRVKRPVNGRRPHPTVRTHLDESLEQAEGLVSTAVSEVYQTRAKLASQLREDILLTFFSRTAFHGTGELPSQDDLKKFERVRRSLKTTFALLGIDREKIETTIDAFFSDVIELSTRISKYSSADEAFNDEDTSVHGALFRWFAIEPQLSLIDTLEALIIRFNDAEKEKFRHINRYLEIMNGFFQDSKKSLFFSEDTSVQIKLPSKNEKGDVSFLSSGERQLFVLITNLMFNNDKDQANILIIDEPELSLHLKWQEMFVDSLLQANSETQLILATHSPSIILDNVKKCVDLA